MRGQDKFLPSATMTIVFLLPSLRCFSEHQFQIRERPEDTCPSNDVAHFFLPLLESQRFVSAYKLLLPRPEASTMSQIDIC